MYYEEVEFLNENFSGKDFREDEFYECVFKNINFKESILAETEFSKCKFENCNFSMADIRNCKLDEVTFENCTFRGINFSEISPMVQEFNVIGCTLEFMVFGDMKLSNMSFEGSEISESNFTKCILKEINFRSCNFNRTMFSGCELVKSDFTGSRNIGIDILNNKIKACKIGRFEAGEMLKQFGFIVELHKIAIVIILIRFYFYLTKEYSCFVGLDIDIIKIYNTRSL